MGKVLSPLTKCESIKQISEFSSHQLIEDWTKAFSIDISTELGQHDRINVYQCNETGLIFYYPFDVAGSEKLYEQLSRFDWYYMPRKWEHDVAIQDLKGCEK
jgi:hypothetical protein